MTSHLLLFDANGLVHRAHHAFTPVVRASDGMEIHAVLGFMSMTWRVLLRAGADPFDYAAAVFDGGGKTFRHGLSSDYKANRTKKPSLNDQMAFMPEAARSLGIEPIQIPGVEADDVIATLADLAKYRSIRTTIITVDKDFCQLVEDGVVEIGDPVKHIRIGEAAVKKIWGVPPSQITYLQALMGDAADNIQGVKSVGEKTAQHIIKTYPTFAELIAALDKGQAPRAIVASLWTKLRKARGELPTYLELVTLKRDVKLGIDIDDLVPQVVTRDHLLDMLKALEAEGHFNSLFGFDKTLFRTVVAKKNPEDWWRTELQKPGQAVPEEPQVGFYKRRLVKGGAFVAARIWREPEIDFETGKKTGNETLCCEVAGERVDPMSTWGYLSRQPITKTDFNFMMDTAAWARAHATKEPEADPFSPVDWNEVKL